MREQDIVWIVIAGIALLVGLLVIVVKRSSSSLNELLMRTAASFGWEGVRRTWWNGALRGTWRGFPVALQHMNRYKGIPERVQITFQTQIAGRLIVKRRTGGFLNKPMTLFGPPLVEPMNFAARDNYWIRSDQAMLVETFFSRGDAGAALDPNLVAAFDVVDLRPNQLRILRAVDDRAVKQRFGRPRFQWKRDLELIETIATEEWRLACATVDSLGLLPRK